ncbi:MAG: Hsp20/alpha crystallin family protein [Methanocorpusculum sp.]|nr:Hsp20/alpha crystallin family protein [Methanocorpusculum sp.]
MSITPYAFSFGFLGSEIDSLLSEMEQRASALVPSSDSIKTAVKNAVPRFMGDFNVDICENDSDIIVVADIPGVEKENISVNLLNENTLVIKTKFDNVVENTQGTYHLRERRCEAGERTIVIPKAVTSDGAKASFKNGIMEITLPKTEKDNGTSIQIE